MADGVALVDDGWRAYGSDRALQAVFDAFCSRSGATGRRGMDESQWLRLCRECGLMEESGAAERVAAGVCLIAAEAGIMSYRGFLKALSLLAAEQNVQLDVLAEAVLQSEGPPEQPAALSMPTPPVSASPRPLHASASPAVALARMPASVALAAAPGPPAAPKRSASAEPIASYMDCFGEGGFLQRALFICSLADDGHLDGLDLRETAAVLEDCMDRADLLDDKAQAVHSVLQSLGRLRERGRFTQTNTSALVAALQADSRTESLFLDYADVSDEAGVLVSCDAFVDLCCAAGYLSRVALLCIFGKSRNSTHDALRRREFTFALARFAAEARISVLDDLFLVLERSGRSSPAGTSAADYNQWQDARCRTADSQSDHQAEDVRLLESLEQETRWQLTPSAAHLAIVLQNNIHLAMIRHTLNIGELFTTSGAEETSRS